MLINENIVIVGQQPWDTTIGSNCKDIALEMSKNNKVLYVNSPLDRITAIRHQQQDTVKKRKEIVASKTNAIVKIKENLWNLYPSCLVESVNWLKPFWLFDYFNARNNRKFAKSITDALTELDFNDFILFNDNEIIKCFYLSDYLDSKLNIYYSRDYILATPYWRKHGLKLEPQIIAKNDLCFANSSYLRDYCKQYNPNAYDVGQGCSIPDSAANPQERPADLERLDNRKPIVGYLGALQSIRLDIELIKHLAESKPEWNIVLVGPEDEQFMNSELHGIPNVIFTGSKPPEQLWQYIQHFDVCINPQLINELTIGNYPRKIDEYLAMGKPVVAIRTEAMNLFKDFVYLANDKEDFVNQVEAALAEDNDESVVTARKLFAASHTWENSVNKMYTVIDEYLCQHQNN